MSTWRDENLGDLCSLITDGKHGDCINEDNSGYYFISCKDVKDGRINYEGAREIVHGDFAETHRRTDLKSGDILLTNSGTIGRLAIAPDDDKTPRTTFQKSVAVLKPLHDKITSRFLYYSLAAEQNRLVNSAGGAAQKNLLLGELRRFSIRVPPLPIQIAVATILSAYDDLIENNRRRIQLLEQGARLLYKEWFVHLRFPGHEHVKIKNGVPEGWSIKKLPEFCSQVIDGTHDSPKPVEHGFPLVTGRHIVNGFIDFANCYQISYQEHAKVMKRSKPEKGDIIFSNIGTLGSTVLVDQDFEFSIKNLALFKPKDKFLSAYLYAYFTYPRSLENILSQASGTSQKFLSLNLLRALPVLMPDKSILKLFEQSLRPLLIQRSVLKKQMESLGKARDLLLPRLMNGVVAV